MQVTLDIPDALVRKVEGEWGSLPRKVLEVLVVEAYNTELITRAEVGHLLNFSHRLQVDEFLKTADAPLHYSFEDFDEDLATLDALEKS